MKRYIFCALLFVALLVFGVTSFATGEDDRFFTVDENGFAIEDIKDSGVIDSGRAFPFPKPANADEAVMQIRDILVFWTFGVLPLFCALLYCYLFGRWIYRLIMSAV